MQHLFLKLIVLLLRVYDFLYPTRINIAGYDIEEGLENKIYLFVFEKENKIFWNFFIGSQVALIRRCNSMKIDHKYLMYISMDEIAKLLESENE